MGHRAEDAVTLLLCAAAIVVAAFLRFHQLGVPCYWLDEVLGDNLTNDAAHAPWWRWITGFEPEHGPLYYATQLAARLFGHNEFAGRLVPALCGIAAVAVAALIAKKIGERPTGIFAVAVVTAISPLHVYFSREARPYGLILLLSTIAVLLLCGAGNLAGEVITLLALLYTTAVAGPLVAAIAVTAVIAKRWRFAALSAATLALFPLLYRGTRVPSDAPVRHLDVSLLADISRSFAVSALDSPVRPATFTAIVVFALIGIVAVYRRNRRTAAILVAMTVLPPLFAVASLQAIGHWFAIRYVIAGLPAFLVLTGAGIAAIPRVAQASSLRPRSRPPGAQAGSLRYTLVAVILGALAFDLVPIASREPTLKADWRSLAAVLKAHARPGDLIVAGQMWSGATMAYYLHDLPPGVRFMGLFDVKGVSSELQKAKAGWLISSGPGNPVRDWMCRYPVVASGELDDVRVTFAPSVSDFVVRHSNAEEMRVAALAAEDDVLLDPGGRNDLLLGGKWGTSEGAPGDRFRWILEREVSIAFPIRGVRTRPITITAMPVTHPKLGPQQMTLSLNGGVVGQVTMHGYLADYTLTAPAPLWRDGLNVLTFTFSRATTPASLIPGSTDQRTLAAAMHHIVIGDPRHAKAPVYIPRLASASLLHLRCASRDARTGFDRRHYNRAGVEALLARLGFDPAEAWPHVAAGEYTIEQIANTAALDNACTDPDTFLEHAFAVLLQRPPNSVQRRDLGALMRTGTTRSKIVARILRDDGFRESVTRSF